MDRTDRNAGRNLLRNVPGWGATEWLLAGFSTRFGGVSQVFAEVNAGGALNLGFVKQDAAEAVAENRRRLLQAANAEGWTLVVPKQVHGVEVHEVTAENLAGAMVDGHGQWEADGLITRVPQVLLGVGAADCVPLLVADRRLRVAGAFHAGWRGTAAGMARAGLERMRQAFGTRAQDCIAAVGPSIGPCCYEVGEEVWAAFDRQAAGETEQELRGRSVLLPAERSGQWRLDLWEANRRQLVAAGVPTAEVTVIGECTACSRDGEGRRRYFSHRAEKGVTGRMLGVIGVR